MEFSWRAGFDVIWSIFRFNYSWYIFSARRIRNEHGESFSEKAHETLDEMIEVLELFGPAREHFKTLYFRWELVNLSRALLYISIPALIIVGIMLMHVGPHTFTGSTTSRGWRRPATQLVSLRS